MIQQSQELGCQFVKSSKCPTTTTLLRPQSSQICLKPAVNFILMVRHLSLSHALPPPAAAFPASRCFSQPCHKTVFLSALYYLCQQRAHGSMRPSCRNTDSDRGNVDWVTSHAFTCPFIHHLNPVQTTG